MTERKSPLTKPMQCHCRSPYQDQRYGNGMRVHNPCLASKTRKLTGWRCTICGHKIEV